MKKVKVTYSQKSWGEVLTDNYTTYVDENNTEQDIINGLYSDPHVISVDIEDVKEAE